MFESIKKLFGNPAATSFKHTGEDTVIVDVRTPFEFRSGHIPGSRNIPLDRLPSKVEDLKKLSKPIITVCRSGARSSTAKSILTAAGLDAYDGGSWTNFKS
ncbi:MAG TPA: rhodanese-like domain-containing protein [Parafilimonas sp.]|nr:rhodanese-like domain-containing protein [Parafilimonas sp.]